MHPATQITSCTEVPSVIEVGLRSTILSGCGYPAQVLVTTLDAQSSPPSLPVGNRSTSYCLGGRRLMVRALNALVPHLLHVRINWNRSPISGVRAHVQISPNCHEYPALEAFSAPAPSSALLSLALHMPVFHVDSAVASSQGM